VDGKNLSHRRSALHDGTGTGPYSGAVAGFSIDAGSWNGVSTGPSIDFDTGDGADTGPFNAAGSWNGATQAPITLAALAAAAENR